MAEYDYIVDAKGGGDFVTIEEAVRAAEKLGGRRRIQVKAGVYYGKTVIPPGSEGEVHGREVHPTSNQTAGGAPQEGGPQAWW